MPKGRGEGYQRREAMLWSRQIYDAIANGSGFFQHGHTYLGHPVATAAALAVMKELTGRNLPERVRDKGAQLMSALTDAFGQHPHVGDIRGRGFFVGVELVENRETKAPFDPSRGIAGKIKKIAVENGLICYPMAGTRDGRQGDHVLLDIMTPDGPYQIEADYLVACDGARSPIRDMMGLGFEGRVFEDNFLIQIKNFVMIFLRLSEVRNKTPC